MSTDPTPTPPPLDLAALRVIAEGATEGPWRIYTVTDSGGRSAAVETAWAHDEQGEDTELVTDWCSPEDAAHIAAFDPPTVLALIARVEEQAGESYLHEVAAKEATARAEAAEATIATVREALKGHPRTCDRHTEDDPIKCGWKRAVAEVTHSLTPRNGDHPHE